MPTYSYHCPKCSESRDIVKPLALLNRYEFCLACDEVLERRICAPAVVSDYSGYSCPITGDWIEGRRAHEQNLAKHGKRLLEPGEREQFIADKAAKERESDVAIEATVAEFVQNLPPRKQEQLATELEHGASVTITRN